MTRSSMLMATALTSATLLLLTACGAPTQPGAQPGEPSSTDDSAPWELPVQPIEYPLTVVDGSGQERVIEAPFTQIGCLYSGCDEILADLGIQPNATLAGGDVGPFLYPVGEPTHLIDVAVSPEEWAMSGSDVIIDLSGPIGDDDERALSPVAPVILLNSPYEVWNPDRVVPGIQAWKEDLWLIGQITDRAAEAAAAIERFDSFMQGLQALAPEGAKDTQVANLSADAPGVFSLLDPLSPFCDALRAHELGECVNIAGWNPSSWAVNSEAFLDADPEWILYTVYDDADSFADRDDPVWNQLTAVKEGNVFDFSRANCCSLRLLQYTLQKYAHHVWGPDSGVPDPGPELSYIPEDSPVIRSGS
ncbi:MAG: ABC transporter substrate-binding protein [Microbacterium sp.]